MDEQLGVGCFGLPALDVRRPDARVDVALAHPDVQLPARDLLEPEPEVQIRQEQDLAVARDCFDYRFRVARRAAVIRLRLDRSRRVDVGDHDCAWIFRLPVPQLVGRDRRCERTAGVEVGNEHGLVRREDLRGLGHEVDAAEDDRVGIGRGRLAGQAERVAHEVRDVLYIRHLVVVREDHGTALLRERTHLLVQRRELGSRHRTSIETSSERAEWVSAPTETKSTPVCATAWTVSSVTPPDASVFARPPTSSTASRSCESDMLSSNRMSAPASSASRTSSSVSHSTSTATPWFRVARTAAATPPARRRWLSLIKIPS